MSSAGLIYYSNAGHIKKTLAGRMWPAGRSLGGAALSAVLGIQEVKRKSI
jgi:hypothetical protein